MRLAVVYDVGQIFVDGSKSLNGQIGPSFRHSIIKDPLGRRQFLDILITSPLVLGASVF